MKSKIIANSLCFAVASKIYKSIRVYVNHSIIYRGFCSFMYHVHNYGQHSKILKYLNRGSENQEISLYKICINKIEKIIANFVQTINSIYIKSSANSLFFIFFRREQENIKKDPYAYTLLTLLGGIVSFNILSPLFNKFYLKQLMISTLFAIVIIVFYLNPSGIIKNSALVNAFVKLLNNGIEE